MFKSKGKSYFCKVCKARVKKKYYESHTQANTIHDLNEKEYQNEWLIVHLPSSIV